MRDKWEKKYQEKGKTKRSLVVFVLQEETFSFYPLLTCGFHTTENETSLSLAGTSFCLFAPTIQHLHIKGTLHIHNFELENIRMESYFGDFLAL